MLLFGFRNGGEHPFKERLAATCGRESAHSTACKLFGAAAERRALPRLQPPRPDDDRAGAEVLPSNNFRFYVCGPGAADGVARAGAVGLGRAGVARSFRGVRAGEREERESCRHEPTQPCEVRFERSDRTATWDGSFASLLEFGEAAGVAMPSGCRAGSCGECMMAIRSGTVSTVKQPGIPVPTGHCLTCISVPAGELVLDA